METYLIYKPINLKIIMKKTKVSHEVNTSKTVNDISTIEVKASFPTMSSFTIKATIPTGAYSNISPEMTFTDCSFDDVENTIMPKMEEMFVKYLGFNDRVKVPHAVSTSSVASTKPTQPAPVVPQVQIVPEPVTENSTVPLSPSMANALAVIESAKTIPALNTMKRKIADSVKLTLEEQDKLNIIIDEKLAGLTG